MTHYLLDKRGDFDRRAIHHRAVTLRRQAIAHGAMGDEATIQHWLKYVWRVARSQHEGAAHRRMEIAARSGMVNDRLTAFCVKQLFPNEGRSL